MKTTALQGRMYAEMADKKLYRQAMTYALRYIDEVSGRTVFPSKSAIRNLAVFDEPLPEASLPGEEVLRQLNDYGSPATVAQTGGGYFGFVNGNVIPTALAARFISDTWDQNAALYIMSPIAAKLEQVCQRWLVDLFDLPKSVVVGLVGGTSIATLCGLAAARYSLLKHQDWDVNESGLFGAPRLRAVVCEEAHATVFKALALLGFGKGVLEIVPADSQGRMDATRVPRLDSQTLLVLQAGNVNTGAFDSFSDLCARARDAKAWVHIDGAFGLWAEASKSKRYLTNGIHLADSWSVDGHKTLNTPYDCGIVLCRHEAALVSALQAGGSYIAYGEGRDGMVYSPDMSRRARSVELWAAMKYLGRIGVEQLIDGMCERAKEFAEQLCDHGFRILNDVVFNQVLVACDTPEQTRVTLDNIQQSGVCWCGGTTWNDEPAIRISVCSWATTAEDITKCVEAFARARLQQT